MPCGAIGKNPFKSKFPPLINETCPKRAIGNLKHSLIVLTNSFNNYLFLLYFKVFFLA